MTNTLVHRLRDAQRAIREWVAPRPLARARACAAVLACAMVASGAHAQTLRPDFQITNGQVNAQVLRGDTLYVGGSFSFVGPVTGAGVPVDTATAQPLVGFPAVNGSVFAAVSDGAGGWYLGGQFTAVGSSPRSNLAYVLADGSVSSWNPGANGAVRAMALRSGVLHCGGDFLSLGGVLRNRIGAVSASTGAVQAWNPNANATVRALVEGATGFYAGGQFTSIGGQVRNRVALLSFATGAADATWNPNANSTVNALHLHAASGTVYAGGQFTAIGGQLRNRAAALDAVSGVARSWNPNVASTVNAIAADAATVYLGGSFTSVGGQARSRIVAIDALTGLPTAWNPNAGNTVQTLLLSGATLYVGGDFLAVGGEARSRLAALSTATGLATAWNPSAFGTVSVLQLDGSRLFVGGSFNGLGGVARNNLAAFDVTTGQVASWNPDANNQVQALALSGDTLVVGGSFTAVAGQVRNGAAAVHAITGALHAFDPNVGGQVSAIAVAHPRVYLGGLFGTVGGQARVNLAAVNSATGAVESWTADTDDQVFAIESTPQDVLVGGNFTLLSGVVRGFIGALDPVSGAATAWIPDANGTVRTITAGCDRIYAGGFFTSIGGQARNRAAALNRTNGQALSWDPNLNGPVFALTPRPGTVYLGGVFSTVGATARNRVAAVDPVSAAVTAWNPNSNGTVRSVVVGGSEAYAGGLFSTMSGAPSGNLAAVPSDASLPCATIGLPSGPISTAVVGGAVARSFPASGGTSPYCYRISSGALPTGLSLDPSTGSVTGTPLTSGTFSFSITATDVRGCTGTVALTWAVAPTPASNGVAPVTTGLCLNPEVSVVQVPFSLVRGDTLALRSVSVTFQVDTTRLRLPTAGPASAHVSAGAWGAAFPNRTLQVTELGGGRYTVEVALTGAPCGVTTGGTLFSVALAAQGPSGVAAVSLVAIGAQDCAGVPVGLNMGAAGGVNVSTSPIVVSPDSLPVAIAGGAYAVSFSATGASGPLTWTVASGALPAGLTLSTAGVLSGTPTASGTFPLVIRATEAAGCRGSLACTLTVACPTIALTPALLPDGSVGAAYSATLGAVGGVAPFTYAVTAGSLPAGLTLSAAGAISGTPSAVGTSILTITATDAAGCTATIEHLVDVYATVPLSTVRAVSLGQALTSARSRVTVPFTYTRGESDSVRGVTVSFQTDPTRVALNDTMTAAIRLGDWTAGYPNTNLQVVQDGPGAWTVDVILLGGSCGITTGGTLFTVDLRSVGPDGPAPIVVTRVKARDCGNLPVPVRAGAIDTLRVQNTDLALTPATLPNGEVGAAYSVALGASNARTPLTFALVAGALPPGLALSSSGVLTGLPTTSGAYSFTVSAADADSVPGQRVFVLTVACPVLVLDPALLADARVGASYSDSIAVLNGSGPFAFTLIEGVLPSGLVLSPTGAISGVPTAPGFHIFTLGATGGSGCTGQATYTINVFADSAVSRIVARTQGLCLTPSNPCVTVPFVYERADTLPARLVHVEFELDARFALCTPAAPYSSIREGTWAGGASTVFQVMSLGANRYGVDLAILGEPCGPDSTVVLFTVDVSAVGGDGVGDLVVTDARVRDCDNQPIPVESGSTATLVVTSTPPSAIADLSVTRVSSGNGTSGRTGLLVSWTPPLEGVVSLYRAPFGSYPEYDDAGGVTPDSALAPGAPWTLVSAAASPGLVDLPPVRGVWHYLAFVTDSCQMRSAPSNLTPGRPNYHLGDVSDGAVRGQGDNRIRVEDISLLGAHYGRTGAAIAAANVAYLDVGPTVDGTPDSRPVTDDVIGFDDLMLFSLGFESVSSPAMRARPAASAERAEATESFEVVAPSRVAAGDEVVAELRLDARGGLQGFAVQLAWDEGVLEPLGSESGGLAESQGGVAYLPRPGAADAALLGVSDVGFTGTGVVARYRFRARRDGDPAVRIATIEARDAANHTVPASRLGATRVPAPPTTTVLLSPAPNPARGAANLAFGLARRGPVELTVLSVDGRRIRTLATGMHEAGDYRVSWRGDDEAGRAQGAGVYWVRLTADGRTQSRRIVYLK